MWSAFVFILTPVKSKSDQINDVQFLWMFTDIMDFIK